MTYQSISLTLDNFPIFSKISGRWSGTGRKPSIVIDTTDHQQCRNPYRERRIHVWIAWIFSILRLQSRCLEPVGSNKCVHVYQGLDEAKSKSNWRKKVKYEIMNREVPYTCKNGLTWYLPNLWKRIRYEFWHFDTMDYNLP